MSQATNTHPVYDVAADSRRTGLLAGLGALAAGVAVVTLLLTLSRVLAIKPRDLSAATSLSLVGRVCVVIGALVAVSLPIMLAIGDQFARDITSLGAVAPR